MIFYLDDNCKKPILVEYNNCIYFLPNKFCTRNHPELSKVIVKSELPPPKGGGFLLTQNFESQSF